MPGGRIGLSSCRLHQPHVPFKEVVISTYVNPVFRRSCPDPFVLRYLDHYWAYWTGISGHGEAFGIARSTDLVHWEDMGWAMTALPQTEWQEYWAPEVLYANG